MTLSDQVLIAIVTAVPTTLAVILSHVNQKRDLREIKGNTKNGNTGTHPVAPIQKPEGE